VERVAGARLGHGTLRAGDEDVAADAGGDRSLRHPGDACFQGAEMRADLAEGDGGDVGQARERAIALRRRETDGEARPREERSVIGSRDLELPARLPVDGRNADDFEAEADLAGTIRARRGGGREPDEERVDLDQALFLVEHGL